MKNTLSSFYKTLLAAFLLLSSVGVWGQVLTENFSALTGDNTTTGGSGTAWIGNANFTSVDKAYQAGGAVKIGTGSLVGSITSKTLDLSTGGGVFSITFDVKGWTTVEGDIIVTPSGGTAQMQAYTATRTSSTFETYTLNFTGGTASQTITIATSAKRAFIDNVVVSVAASGFKVTYNGNGNTTGSVPTDATNYTSGDDVTVFNTGNLAKTNYNPTGWNTLADGSGTDRAAGSIFPISENTTLYAKWTGNISYDLNGGTGTVPTDNTNYLAGKPVNTADYTGTKAGYTFGGWNNANDGSGTNYPENTTGAFNFAGTKTLFAEWITTSPFVTTSGTLSPLSTNYGTASTNTTFTVSAGNLANPLVITPPAGFEVSTDASTYSTSLNLGTGNRTNTTVYVRLAATTAVGFYYGGVSLASTGVATVIVAAAATNTVNPKALTISELNANDKTYDGTTNTLVSGEAVLDGVLFSDDVHVTGTPSANFTDKNAGGGKLVNITGLSLTGNEAGNYFLPTPNAATTANIYQKAITITGATAQNKSYDGNTTATITGETLIGDIPSDDVSISGGGAFVSANAGTGIEVTTNFDLSGADASNYILAQPFGLSADITKADPTYTITTISVGVGGTQTIATSISDSPGALSFSSTNTGIATVGNTTGVVTGVALGSTTVDVAQAASVNYNAGSTTVAVNVTTITYNHGDYRTKIGGTWSYNTTTPGTVQWEKYSSTLGWQDNAGNTPSGTNFTAYITKDTEIPTNSPSNGNATIIIMRDPDTNVAPTLTFNSSNIWTFRGITIEEGANLLFNTRLQVLAAGIFEIKDDGYFTFNYSSNGNPLSGLKLWDGTEIFHPNSNFIIKNHLTGSNYLLPTGGTTTGAANISPNVFSGVNGYFGNLIIESTNGEARITTTNLSSTTTYLTHGNLEIKPTGNYTLFYGTGTWIIGKDFLIKPNTGSPTITYSLTLANATNTPTITVKGSFINNSKNNFRLFNGTSGTVNLNVDKNIELRDEGKLDLKLAAGFTVTNLKGDLTVESSAALIATNGTTATFNFAGTGDGTTNVLTQTIDVANAATASNITFNVNDKAYVKLINQDFSLGTSSKFNVLGGGTLNFGFNGTTALNLVNSVNSTTFTTLAGSILKITSPYGITTNPASATAGNVQTTSTTRTYSGDATYHYIGKTHQSSGNGLPGAASAKKVIVELETTNSPANDDLNLTIDGLKYFTSAGELEIRKGTVIDAPSNGFADATFEDGKLTMSGGRYKISRGGTQPSMSGDYSLTDGVIELAGTSAISIRTGVTPKQYLNIEVSGSNVFAGTTDTAGLTFQPNGRFTVKDTGTFKVNNPDGFSDGLITAVKNTNDPQITLEDGSTVEYSRADAQTITDFKPLLADNSNLTTGGYYNLKISGDNGNLQTGTAKTILSATPIYVRNKVDVEASARLIIDAEKVLIVRNEVNNNSGAATGFIVESDGNLKQLEDVTNTTAISVRRLLNLSDANRKEYNFFSSPVAGQNMKLIYGGVPANVPFVTVLNEATNYFVNAVAADWTKEARGFAVKEPKTSYLDMPAESLLENEVEYKGVPNNGDAISINLTRTSSSKGYNVVGNPYPSNIDIVKLWKNSVTDWENDETPEISADFRFWDNKANSTYVQMGGAYQGYSYAIFNAKSQSSTAAPGLDPNNDGSASGIIPPGSIIKVSQAFMVRALQDNVPMKFNNSMREVAQGTSYYGKDASINRYRLQLRTSEDFVIQNAVTYIPVGTTSFGIEDTRIPNSSASDALFSYAGDAKVIINGRSNFMIDDVVILGLRHFTAGTYKIQAVDQEGIFANGQSIYLKDKELGTIADLTAGDYTFTSNSGEYTNRFEIIYQPGSVLVTDESGKSSVEVYRDAMDFVVHSSTKAIDSVELYDASGRLLLRLKGNNGKELRFNAEQLVDGMYVLKAMMKGGEPLTKKIRK